MELVEFLTYLSGVGVVAALSFVFERMVWFQALDAKYKEYVFFGACAVVALLAKAALVYVPVEILTEIGSWFSVVSTLFVYLFLGKQFHKVDKQEKYIEFTAEEMAE
jgi:hypothetical protein